MHYVPCTYLCQACHCQDTDNQCRAPTQSCAARLSLWGPGFLSSGYTSHLDACWPDLLLASCANHHFLSFLNSLFSSLWVILQYLHLVGVWDIQALRGSSSGTAAVQPRFDVWLVVQGNACIMKCSMRSAVRSTLLFSGIPNTAVIAEGQHQGQQPKSLLIFL